MKKAILSRKYYTTSSQVPPLHVFRGQGFRFLILCLFILSGVLANAQTPTISGLSLDASSPNDLTIDVLTADFTPSGSVTETTTAWVKFGEPEAILQMPCEVDSLTALLDYSGRGNDAFHGVSALRVPHWDATSGYNGSGAFNFDGDDFLRGGDIFPLNSSYTKMAWVNLGSTGFRNIISSIDFEHRNHFLKIDGAYLNAGHSRGTAIVEDDEAMNTDEWYFVAVTFDYASGDMILYKNGVEVDAANVVDTLRSVEYPSVLLGSMLYSWGFVGSIDEPRIYDHALSPEQINSFYVNGFNEIVPEETQGRDLWRAMVTPFSSTQVGTTYGSNSLRVNSMLVTQIADQTISEGSTFDLIDLDDYVIDYEHLDDELDWTSSGSSELDVDINPGDHIATITTPGENWFGSEVITFTVTNPRTENHDIVVTFTVNSENDYPVITEVGPQSTDEDNDVIGMSVIFSDADVSDSHTITVESDEGNVTVDNLNGNISGSTYNLLLTQDWFGTAEITVTVTDDGVGALTDVETYTLTVDPGNDAPVLTPSGDQSTNEDTTLTGISVIFTDIDDGDSHTITVLSDDANVTMDNLTGHISGSQYDLVPVGDWNGTAQITVMVTDDGTGALSGSETYTFTVNNVNDEPVITDIGAQSTDEEVHLTDLSVTFTDPDASDTHNITVVSSDANVTMANLSGHVSGSTYDLELEADWFGTAQITVRVTDDGTGALSDFETYTLTVNPINDAPRITEVGDQNVDEDQVLSKIPIIFTDEATDSHVVEIVSSEPKVVVANFGGHTSGSTYTLVPVGNWNGTAQITVTVTEVGSGGLSDMEVYTLTVNNINDDPTALELSNPTVEERVALGTVVGQFTTTDIDVDDIHLYTFILDGGVNDVDNDAFIIDGDTLKTNVELDFEVQSSYSILVQSDDGAGGTISQNFTITVGDLNETSVEDIYNSPVFNVYPVPAVDHVTVEVDNPDNKELLLEIYSNTGRLVHAEPIFSKNRIDLTGFSDGMYILRIKGEQVYGTRKLIVKDR